MRMDEVREKVSKRLKGMGKEDKDFLILQGILTIIGELHEIKKELGKKKDKKEKKGQV